MILCVHVCLCVCVVGVGGAGQGGFREVSREASELRAGLGEKLQGPES